MAPLRWSFFGALRVFLSRLFAQVRIEVFDRTPEAKSRRTAIESGEANFSLRTCYSMKAGSLITKNLVKCRRRFMFSDKGKRLRP